jgi:Peptidase family M23
MKAIFSIFFFASVIFSNELNAQVEKNKLIEYSKGKWPLPIPQSQQAIEEMKIKYQGYPGISFLADSSYPVKAVFEAVVVSVFTLSENNYHLMARFGDYFIVYSNINKPELVKGDTIKRGQIIGTLSKEPDEPHYELNMLLFKPSNKSAPNGLPLYKWFNWENNYLNECSD